MTKALPIPLWLVVVMFVVGIAAGLGLGLVVSKSQVVEIPEKPWDDKRTSSIPVDAIEKGSKKAEDKIKKEKTEETVTLKGPKYKKKDKRLVKNMINGPVKRAVRDGLYKLKPHIDECRAVAYPKPPAHSQELVFLFEFEAVGGMATILTTEIVKPEENDKTVQSCLIKKISQLLIDFPVEDGTYQILHPVIYKAK